MLYPIAAWSRFKMSFTHQRARGNVKGVVRVCVCVSVCVSMYVCTAV